MRHGQHHVALSPVLKPRHLIPDLIPAMGLLPDVGRVHDRHGDFLPANGINFFTDDIFNFGQRSSPQRQVAINTSGQRPDESGLEEEHMAGDFGLSRNVSQCLTK